MSFAKILCPVDFSPGSQNAMKVAARMAGTSAELVIAHAWYLPPLAFAGELPLPPSTIQDMIDDEHRGLEEATREATKLGATRVSSTFLSGAAGDRIVATLRDDPAFDLVVMGTHGRTGLKRILLGSVAEYVVRHAPCSVLATREHGEPGRYKNILVPVDFSPSSRHAIDLAAQVVEAGGAGITLLHVIELPVTYSGEPHMAAFLTDLDKRATYMLEDWASALKSKVSVPVATRARIGRPGGQTLALLDEDPTFDLVVMGSHGRTGLSRVFLGSVAEKVVRHAQCPVLVARPRSTPAAG